MPKDYAYSVKFPIKFSYYLWKCICTDSRRVYQLSDATMTAIKYRRSIFWHQRTGFYHYPDSDFQVNQQNDFGLCELSKKVKYLC